MSDMKLADLATGCGITLGEAARILMAARELAEMMPPCEGKMENGEGGGMVGVNVTLLSQGAQSILPCGVGEGMGGAYESSPSAARPAISPRAAWETTSC